VSVRCVALLKLTGSTEPLVHVLDLAPEDYSAAAEHEPRTEGVTP